MEHRSGRIDRAPAVKATDKGRDWRAEVGARSDSASPVDLARAREPGRGREANTPEQIPPRGWRLRPPNSVSRNGDRLSLGGSLARAKTSVELRPTPPVVGLRTAYATPHVSRRSIRHRQADARELLDLLPVAPRGGASGMAGRWLTPGANKCQHFAMHL